MAGNCGGERRPRRARGDAVGGSGRLRGGAQQNEDADADPIIGDTHNETDDDFGMEWDGDLMRVDLEHSLLETAALVSLWE